MSYHARTILTPGASRKRKERESFYASAAAQAAAATTPAATSTKPTAKEGAVEPVTPDNRLLAGYMAHEFLTRGTVLGARPEAARQQPEGKPSGSYGEVASILKAEGVHVAGILNPSQLAQWIHM